MISLALVCPKLPTRTGDTKTIMVDCRVVLSENRKFVVCFVLFGGWGCGESMGLLCVIFQRIHL